MIAYYIIKIWKLSHVCVCVCMCLVLGEEKGFAWEEVGVRIMCVLRAVLGEAFVKFTCMGSNLRQGCQSTSYQSTWKLLCMAFMIHV